MKLELLRLSVLSRAVQALNRCISLFVILWEWLSAAIIAA
jgi:hypothetical protein